MKRFHAFFVMFSVLLTSLSTIAPSALSAADNDKMRLAIIDLQAKGVSTVVGVAVTDLIRSDMVDTGRFVIVERSQMDAIMKEQGLQQTGCTDSSCAVQLGKILSANKVLIGEINKLGEDIIITARVVDVEKGVAEFSTSEKAKNIDEIDKTVKTLVDKLTVRITGKRSLAGETGASAYYLRGIVPGWAQMYAGQTTKGWLFAGGFAATACVFVYSFFDYSDKKDAYDNLGPRSSESKFDSYYDDKKQAYNVMFYSGVLLGLIYIGNWVDVVFFTDSPGVIVSGFPMENGIIVFNAQKRSEKADYSYSETCFNMSYRINF